MTTRAVMLRMVPPKTRQKTDSFSSGLDDPAGAVSAARSVSAARIRWRSLVRYPGGVSSWGSSRVILFGSTADVLLGTGAGAGRVAGGGAGYRGGTAETTPMRRGQ